MLELQLCEQFVLNPGAWTLRALVLDPSLALRLEQLFTEGRISCSTAQELLETDLFELETDDELAKILTPDPAEHAHTGTTSSSRFITDRNADGEPPARRPKCRASILNRLLNDAIVAAELTAQQKLEVLVDRDRYMEHIGLHDLGSYCNQDHGYFNTTLFYKDNIRLFPRLGVIV